MRLTMPLLFSLILGHGLAAEPLLLSPLPVTEWKSVYGSVETRDRIPARARISGTVVTLTVTEGDRVEAGQLVATIVDDKLSFQEDAMDARLEALRARLATAEADLTRGESLKERGVITAQRLDALQTAVDVIRGEIAGAEADRLVVRRQIEEGQVLAPESGIVLQVPVARGSVVGPGEALAEIGGGGVFLRLAVPERHAEALHQGDPIQIEGAQGVQAGVLAKVYPLISGGRVAADVEVEGLDPRFIGRRIAVRLPVGTRQALLVPETALRRHGGLDFVQVRIGDEIRQRTVVAGADVMQNGERFREILSGLQAGDAVVLEAAMHKGAAHE